MNLIYFVKDLQQFQTRGMGLLARGQAIDFRLNVNIQNTILLPGARMLSKVFLFFFKSFKDFLMVWIFEDICEDLRIFVDIYENFWIFVYVCGNFKKFVEICGYWRNLWKLVVIWGNLWIFVHVSGYLGYFWILVDIVKICGNVLNGIVKKRVLLIKSQFVNKRTYYFLYIFPEIKIRKVRKIYLEHLPDRFSA